MSCICAQQAHSRLAEIEEEKTQARTLDAFIYYGLVTHRIWRYKTIRISVASSSSSIESYTGKNMSINELVRVFSSINFFSSEDLTVFELEYWKINKKSSSSSDNNACHSCWFPLLTENCYGSLNSSTDPYSLTTLYIRVLLLRSAMNTSNTFSREASNLICAPAAAASRSKQQYY